MYQSFIESQLETRFFVEFLEKPIRNILKTVKQMFAYIVVLTITHNHHIIMFVKQILTFATNQVILTSDAVPTDPNNVVVLHCGYSVSAV